MELNRKFGIVGAILFMLVLAVFAVADYSITDTSTGLGYTYDSTTDTHNLAGNTFNSTHIITNTLSATTILGDGSALTGVSGVWNHSGTTLTPVNSGDNTLDMSGAPAEIKMLVPPGEGFILDDGTDEFWYAFPDETQMTDGVGAVVFQISSGNIDFSQKASIDVNLRVPTGQALNIQQGSTTRLAVSDNLINLGGMSGIPHIDSGGSGLQISEELNITSVSGDGLGKVVCITANGNLGTCNDAVNSTGLCDCV